MTVNDRQAFESVRGALARGSRFLLTSHARPDGDSIGSQVALALALEHLGKSIRIVNADPPPSPYRAFEGTERIEVTNSASGEYDAVVVLECGDLTRPGVAGLDRYPAINIDHHAGNTGYGVAAWFDPSAAACTEMVVDILDALEVPLTRAIAAQIYLGILTDTGSFRHANITARTFDICRRVAEAGVDPADMAHMVYNSASIGRLKLLGALLDHMSLAVDDRVAVLYYDDQLLEALGASIDDTEGLINLPLSAKTIDAVLLLKGQRGSGDLRASLRSKRQVDVRAVASRFGGGGHVNAAGCTVAGPREAAEHALVAALREALQAVPPSRDER